MLYLAFLLKNGGDSAITFFLFFPYNKIKKYENEYFFIKEKGVIKMAPGQKSIRGGVEDFLCPFVDMRITQGSNSNYSHKGIMANDVAGKVAGIKYPYYAPCTCKCLRTYPSSGQVMWQSTKKVRFANGRIDYATFMTVHDNTMDARVGQVVRQGSKLGNMGTKGNATGVHCHIEVSQSADTSWTKNQHGIYHFNHEYDLDDCYFTDQTNIIDGKGGNWRTTDKVKVQSSAESKKNYVNLPGNIDTWNFYDINVAPVKKNAKGQLKPSKFGGLSYYVYEYRDQGTTAVINTVQFGKVKIYIKDTPATITVGSYQYSSGNH